MTALAKPALKVPSVDKRARVAGRQRHGVLNKVLAYVALSVAALLTLAPLVWIGLTSIKPPIDAYALPPVWQFAPTIEAYQILWWERGFGGYLVTTLTVALATTVLSLVIAAPAAYALARYPGPIGLWLLILALVFRALPRMAVVLPFYWFAQLTGLYDTQVLLVIVLTAVNQPFTLWLLRNFFRGLPEELEESAMVDGCTRFSAFRRVILPLVAPGLLTAGIFTFLLAYQEYLIPVVLTQTNAVTLPVFVAQFSTENIEDWPIIAAAGTALALPVAALALIAQRYLVAGLTAGSVKG